MTISSNQKRILSEDRIDIITKLRDFMGAKASEEKHEEKKPEENIEKPKPDKEISINSGESEDIGAEENKLETEIPNETEELPGETIELQSETEKPIDKTPADIGDLVSEIKRDFSYNAKGYKATADITKEKTRTKLAKIYNGIDKAFISKPNIIPEESYGNQFFEFEGKIRFGKKSIPYYIEIFPKKKLINIVFYSLYVLKSLEENKNPQQEDIILITKGTIIKLANRVWKETKDNLYTEWFHDSEPIYNYRINAKYFTVPATPESQEILEKEKQARVIATNEIEEVANLFETEPNDEGLHNLVADSAGDKIVEVTGLDKPTADRIAKEVLYDKYGTTEDEDGWGTDQEEGDEINSKEFKDWMDKNETKEEEYNEEELDNIVDELEDAELEDIEEISNNEEFANIFASPPGEPKSSLLDKFKGLLHRVSERIQNQENIEPEKKSRLIQRIESIAAQRAKEQADKPKGRIRQGIENLTARITGEPTDKERTNRKDSDYYKDLLRDDKLRPEQLKRFKENQERFNINDNTVRKAKNLWTELYPNDDTHNELVRKIANIILLDGDKEALEKFYSRNIRDLFNLPDIPITRWIANEVRKGARSFNAQESIQSIDKYLNMILEQGHMEVVGNYPGALEGAKKKREYGNLSFIKDVKSRDRFAKWLRGGK